MGQLEAGRQTKNQANRVAVLVVGDFLTMLIFVWIGRVSHSFSGLDILGSLSVALPFLISWFLITPWFGLFRAYVSQSWRQLVPRLLIAWAIGGPVALVLRNLFLGRPLIGGIIPTFALIMVGGITIFMLIWRLGYLWWVNRHSS